jgi:hypothetical protein
MFVSRGIRVVAKSASDLRDVRLSVPIYQRCPSTGRISVKFDTGTFIKKICVENVNLFTILQKYRALCMKFYFWR